MGRPPSAIDDAKTRIIIRAIEEGQTLRCACALADVDWNTFKFWRSRGKAGDEPYASFLALTRAAEATAHASAVSVILERMNAAGREGRKHVDDGATKAAQWYLERRHWKDWYQRKEATNKDPARMSDEELRAALERELRALDERKKRDDDD